AFAPGIDRIVMLLCGEENLREVVLFPMNQRAEDLMMGAPSEVSPKQLRELHIRVVKPGLRKTNPLHREQIALRLLSVERPQQVSPDEPPPRMLKLWFFKIHDLQGDFRKCRENRLSGSAEILCPPTRWAACSLRERAGRNTSRPQQKAGTAL